MKQENNIHTYAQTIIFRAKVSLLQLKRGVQNNLDTKIKRFPVNDEFSEQTIIAESRTPLWTESEPEEQILLAGKVHNLRLAVKNLNNLEVPANEIFSFWKHVKRASRWNGYVEGRELREGCIIPNIGGGLCQLSNALYDAALKADFEIVERYAHTQIVAGSLAEQGRDATVFWNYVDLRFKSPIAFRIEAKLGKDHLNIRFTSNGKKQISVPSSAISTAKTNLKSESNQPKSCATCGVESCFRSLKTNTNLTFGQTAFLLDEFTPEFDEYVQKARSANDCLFVPLDGKRFKRANYAWTIQGFARVKQSLYVTAERSYKSRKLAAQGAARQRNLLSMYEKLADSYAKHLKYSQTNLVVQQNLLPFLWKTGVLGGRRFDVLMSSLPMESLQKNLDHAASLHAESKTLGDFRADFHLINAESEALQNADKIITSHTKIASMFPGKTELLEWKMPAPKAFTKKPNEKYTIVFPASTVGRKGCYELREAAKDLNVKLLVLGAELEGADFWREIDYEKAGDDWLETADLVVLPAFVEHKPRRLLQAAANQIPSVASTNCGLENVKGIVNIPCGDAIRLRREIENAMAMNAALS